VTELAAPPVIQVKPAAPPIAAATRFPSQLLEWAGHRSGGVRRLFDSDSGRPAGSVIETSLVRRLRGWAAAQAEEHADQPSVLLLVGGPGNGKTDAIEETIRGLDVALATSGQLESHLRACFNPSDGTVVPRRVDVWLPELSPSARDLTITIVQDASVGDEAQAHRSPAALLCDDLEGALASGGAHVYLACVNRGVLDDASVVAMADDRAATRELLSAVVQAVAVSPGAQSCWPLAGYQQVAVWPMDVESLLVRDGSKADSPSPASQVLSVAISEADWPAKDACPAGGRCPFCRSREVLAGAGHGDALLRMLRWYELASGKRWSFRDLYSLVSYLLAGAPPAEQSGGRHPCQWAAGLLALASAGPAAGGGAAAERKRQLAPYQLVAAEFQHALFGRWPRDAGHTLRSDLRELKLSNNATLAGLHLFLTAPKPTSVPATLRAQLDDICELLDPAVADPDAAIPLSSATTVFLREIDARFSRSVRDGLLYLKKYHCLSPNEIELLGQLDDAEGQIGRCAQRAKRPVAATRVEQLLRAFACTLARRAVGARAALVRDVATLGHFEKVVAGDMELVHHTVKQVDTLLNDGHHFHVSLNTTFGEPLPPQRRKVVLRAPKQKVQRAVPAVPNRPRADAQFLAFGPPDRRQHIALTYALFRSVRELRDGMMPSSLPREVVAALDAARARLAGHVVRDAEQLEGAEIHIGIRDEHLVHELGSFQIVRGD
jgi:hypothetical protein